MGKIFNPLFSGFLNNPPAKISLPEKTGPESFRVSENNKILSIYDNSGEEIFQIDKEA